MLRFVIIVFIGLYFIGCKKHNDDTSAVDPGASWQKIGNSGGGVFDAKVYHNQLCLLTGTGIIKINADGNVLESDPLSPRNSWADGGLQKDFYITNVKVATDTFYTCFNSYKNQSSKLLLRSLDYKLPSDTTFPQSASYSFNLDTTTGPAVLITNGTNNNNTVPPYYSLALYTLSADSTTGVLSNLQLKQVYSLKGISSYPYLYPTNVYAIKGKYLINGYNETHIIYSDGSHKKILDQIVKPVILYQDTIYGVSYDPYDNFSKNLYWSVDAENWTYMGSSNYINHLIVVGKHLVTFNTWVDVFNLKTQQYLYPDMTGVERLEVTLCIEFNGYVYVGTYDGTLYRKKTSYFF